MEQSGWLDIRSVIGYSHNVSEHLGASWRRRWTMLSAVMCSSDLPCKLSVQSLADERGE
jgi:hypothetical protein